MCVADGLGEEKKQGSRHGLGTRERVAVFASKFELLNIKRDVFFVSLGEVTRHFGWLRLCVRCRLGPSPSALAHFFMCGKNGKKRRRRRGKYTTGENSQRADFAPKFSALLTNEYCGCTFSLAHSVAWNKMNVS